MNITANFEHRAGSSQSKHEGEPSFALCDRLSRIRDNSQRQLPTDHDYAVPTREYQTDQSSLNLPRLLLALSSRKSKNNYKNTHRLAELTRSLHIRGQYSGQVGPVYIEPTDNSACYDREVFLTMPDDERVRADV